MMVEYETTLGILVSAIQDDRDYLRIRVEELHLDGTIIPTKTLPPEFRQVLNDLVFKHIELDVH